jgi:hypothetical protein
MTAGRRPRKRHVHWLALALLLAGAAPPLAAATERIVTDRHTGLALYGIDPVAYFTDGKPLEGKPNFELTHAGAIWRFENDGNRAAFAADPEVYMPRFGGYDPVGVSRGLATPGYPSLWVVHDQRLFLFYTAQARAAFLANPASAIVAASARWSTVRSELAD